MATGDIEPFNIVVGDAGATGCYKDEYGVVYEENPDAMSVFLSSLSSYNLIPDSYNVPSSVTYIETGISYKVNGIGSADTEEDVGVGLSYAKTIKALTISNNIQYISQYSFAHCDQLSSFRIGSASLLSSIGANAFLDDGRLKKMNMPDSLLEIGHDSFYNCSSLTELNFNLTSRVSSIGSNAFINAQLQSLNLSNTRMTNIDQACFLNNSSLGFVSLPSSLTNIGESTFANCYSLSKVNFPKIMVMSSISKALFFNDVRLTEIILPDNISSISDYSFASTGLTTIALPKGCDATNSRILGLSSFYGSPFTNIQVTSNFNNFGILKQSNTGLLSSFMSTVYTFGVNSNDRTGCEYSTINSLLNVQSDSNIFKALTRSTNDPLTFTNFNANFLVQTGSVNPNSLSNITLYYPGNPAVLPPNLNSRIYFPLNDGESVQVIANGKSYTLTQINTSLITLDGTPVSVNNKVKIGDIDYLFEFGGSAGFLPLIPCLLEGTLVRTPTHYKPIETFQVGDYILSHCNLAKKVTKVGKWKCTYDEHESSQTMYKLPRGSYGALDPVYLSKLHKISNGSRMLYPATLKLEKADPREFTNRGKYTIYNLEVENGVLNHLVVNGECVVDSWVL
jgi:hypothetical protein